MAPEFEVLGANASAPFTLKVRRGEGMVLLAMNWKEGTPPDAFAGFAIELQAPGQQQFAPLSNRIAFLRADGTVDTAPESTMLAPIQKFRWVHFPHDADVAGDFSYRVTPVSMDDNDKLSYGEAQTAAIALGGETYPDELNVAFTRGFVSSQAFVDEWQAFGDISTLLPTNADQGLSFTPTHPKAAAALDWMGFEARRAILDVLDQAIADQTAQVRVIAYDLNEPEVVSRLKQLGSRLMVIVDNSGSHGPSGSAESTAATELAQTAGGDHVKRQHMGNLQHNKTIVVSGPQTKAVVCGSTNFSWRGFYVQSNNAVVMRGDGAVNAFLAAFDAYWQHDNPAGFGASVAAQLNAVGLQDVDVQVGFSPHAAENALLATIAGDIANGTQSSLLYSLAFLYQTPGPILDAIKQVTADDAIFVYGISDRKVGGLDLQKPSGNVAPVFPAALTHNVPEPFKSEPTAGAGVRMHHKFLVIDFDTPTARVYLGSYNFSAAADTANGENMVLIKDRRVATSYAVEALRIFDHYHFRVARQEAQDQLALHKPPRAPGEKPWWDAYYTDPQHVRDREIFA